MDLTSNTLEYAAGALTAVCVCATVWLWPRLARAGLRWVAGRLAMIVTTQLSLLLLVALMLNDYGDFYPTWTDLTGGGDQTVTVGRSSVEDQPVSLAGSRLVLPADSSGLDRQPGLPHGPADQVGRISAVTIRGARTGYRQQAYVYLPPQYFQSAYQHTGFPVLTSYVGYPGSIQGVVALLRLPQTAAGLMTTGDLPPTIVVLISQTIAPPRDTECVDVVGGPQVETYLTSDFQTAMRSVYRVRPEPRAWALIGFSEGGTCAVESAMRNPERFGIAVSLGGEFRDYETGQSGTLFGSAGPARTRLQNGYDLVWRLQHLPAPDVRLLVATTAHGERDYGVTQQFMHAVRPPTLATPLVLSSGGHNYRTWVLELKPALGWLGRQLLPPGGAPLPSGTARPGAGRAPGGSASPSASAAGTAPGGAAAEAAGTLALAPHATPGATPRAAVPG